MRREEIEVESCAITLYYTVGINDTKTREGGGGESDSGM